MARLRHRPKDADVGFKPIQLSRASIARMEEESNRVINNLKFQQNWEYNQRQEILSQMKQDADYADRVAARNFKTQQEAARAEQINRQLAADVEQQQMQINADVADKTMQGLMKFSTSLAAAAEAEQKRQRESAEWQAQLEYSNLVLTDETLVVKFAENQLDQRGEKERHQADVEEANGQDPATVSMMRVANQATTHKIDQANNNHMLGVEMPLYIKNAVAQNQDRVINIDGQEMTIRAALANPKYTNAVHDAYARLFIKEHNINLTEREYNKAGIEKYMQWRAIQEHETVDKFVKTNNETTLAREDYLLSQAAGTANFANQAQSWWMTHVSILGYEGALDKLKKLGIMTDPQTGEYLYDPEELAAIQTGETTFGERKGRYGEMMLAREKASENRMRLMDAQDARHRESFIEENFSAIIQEKIANGNLSKADVEEAIKQITIQIGAQYVPSWYHKVGEQFTLEAVNKRETLETYSKYAKLGLLNQQMVNSALEMDYKTGIALQRQLDAYDAVYKSDVYKDAVKSLGKLAGKQLGFLDPADSSGAAFFLSNALEKELKAQIQAAQAVDPNVNLDALIPELALKIQSEVDVNDPGNKYYKGDLNTASDTPTFPKLVTGTANSSVVGMRRIKDFDTFVRNWGGNKTAMDKALNTPYRVLTKEEGEYLLENFGKPGFKFPVMVDYIVGTTGGKMDPFVVANRALKANGQGELKVPEIVQKLNTEVDPRFRQIIYNKLSGQKSRNRAVEEAHARRVNPQRLQRPAVLRGNFKRSFTGALTYQDNPEPYVLAGTLFEKLGFKVAEHPDFGGIAPVHAGNSYHGYGEAFDITHQVGEYNASIEKTRQLKEAIRSMGLFEEIIGPGDGDPDHETHLHLGGLMRPITQEDIDKLESLLN
jgi:hypothetical protein